MLQLVSTQTLPANYTLAGTIDLSKDRRALWILNFIALVLFLFSAWFLVWLAVTIRPSSAARGFSFSSGSLGSLVGWLVYIVATTIGMVVIHEAIHGLFFWFFTASRPRFGFRGTYAFASAPDWFIPRHLYLVIALAPLVLMTFVGLAAIFVVPDNLLPALLFLIAMNFSSSVGDMMVAGWLLRKPTGILSQDYGYAVRFFRPLKCG
jgi:hypothetical protein